MTIQITPENILAAYEQTGLIPLRLDWATELENGKKCACGLSALYVSYSSSNEAEAYQYLTTTLNELEDVISGELGVSYDFIRGFTNGFDGIAIYPYWSEEIKEAFFIGQKTWEAVKHLYPSDDEGGDE